MDDVTAMLRQVHTKAMDMAGLTNPERVTIEFDVYSGSDGGPWYSIVVKIPPTDKRRLDDKTRGSGDTLAAALEELRERLDSAGQLKEGT